VLKSRIHRARLAGVRLDYEGSIAVDTDLLYAADMLPGEQAHVLSMANGSRLVTYIIEAPAGSGTVMLNGPAARLGSEGDEVIIPTCCDRGARQFKHRVVVVDGDNRPRHAPEVAS
jgi:aspartate 1-decarboxylase